MKVWPIDPLVPRNLRLEVPEKLPQGLPWAVVPDFADAVDASTRLVLGILPCKNPEVL